MVIKRFDAPKNVKKSNIPPNVRDYVPNKATAIKETITIESNDIYLQNTLRDLGVDEQTLLAKGYVKEGDEYKLYNASKKIINSIYVNKTQSGVLIKTYDYDYKNGKISKKTPLSKKEYDQYGRITGEVEYSSKGEYNTSIKYDYDTGKKLIKYYDNDGAVKKKVLAVMTAEGDKILSVKKYTQEKNVPSQKTSFGKIGGTWYANVTEQEILNNKLDPKSKAIVSANLESARKSQELLSSGKGTSADILNVLTKGSGKSIVGYDKYNKPIIVQGAQIIDQQGVELARKSAVAGKQAKIVQVQINPVSGERKIIGYSAGVTTTEQKNALKDAYRRMEVLRPTLPQERRGSAVVVNYDPVTRVSTLQGQSRNVNYADAQRFVNSLNEEEKVRLVQEFLAYRKELRQAGRYDIVDKLRIFYNRGAQSLNTLRKNERDSALTTASLILASGIMGAGSGVLGAAETFRHPIKTAKGTIQLVTQPIKTGKAIVEQFRTNPVYATSELLAGIYATNKIMQGAGVATKTVLTPLGKKLSVGAIKVKKIPVVADKPVGTTFVTKSGDFGIVLRRGNVFRFGEELTPLRLVRFQKVLNRVYGVAFNEVGVLKIPTAKILAGTTKAVRTLYNPLWEIPSSIFKGLRRSKDFIVTKAGVQIRKGINLYKTELGAKISKNAIPVKVMPVRVDPSLRGYFLKSKDSLGLVNKKGKVILIDPENPSRLLVILNNLFPEYLGTAQGGEIINIKLANGVLRLQVAKSLPKMSIPEQVALSGKRINAVSTQGQELVNLFRQNRVIRKPLPNEATLSAPTKAKVKLFDEGKLTTNKEIYDLDLAIRREVGMGLIERSFFADPRGTIRPSRAGLDLASTSTSKFLESLGAEGYTLKDILSSIKNRGGKPQILVFRNLVVDKLPKSLNTIKQKIISMQKLTDSELGTLLKWQSSVSGKAKPLGKINKRGILTREAEVTLAPNEIIRRQRILGFVTSYGKRIPVVEVAVVKPTGIFKNLLAKYEKGTITISEVKRLRTVAYAQTGIKYKFDTKKLKNIVYSPKARKYVDWDLVGSRYSSKLGYALKKEFGLSNYASIKEANYYFATKYAPSTGNSIETYLAKNYSPAYVSEYKSVSNYPVGSNYPSVTKYGAVPKYPSITKYPSVPKYPSTPKYQTVPKYPSITKYPSVPKYPSISKTEKVPQKQLLLYYAQNPDKRPKGTRFMFNALIKKQGRVREIPLRTTYWRAVGKTARYVDTTLVRSFDIKIVGLTRKQDISPIRLLKFRPKKTKNPLVLRFVEKSKYALDTQSEKSEIQRSKSLKR